MLLKTPDNSFAFVSQADLVKALFNGFVSDNLQGAGSIRFRKLGIYRRVLFFVEKGTRALQAFRLMSDHGIQAVPITTKVDAHGILHEHHRYLTGEVSLTQLRGLKSSNFNSLMGGWLCVCVFSFLS